VTRRSCLIVVFGVFPALPLFSQHSTQSSSKPESSGPATVQSQAPGDESLPEEDESERKTEYTYNPLQAQHELNVGNFYFRSKKYNSAVGRYSEATKWNPGWPEAYLKLGEAEAKLHQNDAAKKSLSKVIQLSPDSKEARDARKLLSKL
jgi:tetratricopeptide (TPR) repeat protein